ncbi:MAG: ATP-binding cassette domain-containing protein [Bacteroidota bacterium]
MDSNSAPLTPLDRLIRLFRPDKEEIRNVYIYAIFAGLVSLSLPLGIQAIVNLIQGGQVNTAWIVLVVFVVVGVAVSGVLQIFQLRITENLQQKIFTRASFEFAYRLPRIKMEAMYKHYAPELTNRFFDVINVQKGLSKLLIDFSTGALQVIFGILLLSFYHPFFILFGIILVIIVYAIVRYTVPKGIKTSLYESKQKYRVAHWLEEISRAYFSFKLSTNSDLAIRKTNVIADEYLAARESHFSVLVQQYSLLVFFKVVVATGLLAIGGVLVMEQLMNIGQFVAAEIIILTIMSSIEKLISSLETIYDVITGLEKIAQVTDLETEHSEGVHVNQNASAKGMHLHVEDVQFTYPNYYRQSLKDLTLDVRAGARISVTGENGSGKTTLLQILAGFYDIQDGSILYDGLPKGNLDLNTLRAHIGVSFTDENLFDGTLEENIAMGRDGITFNDLTRVSDALFLTEYVKELPEGFKTHIDPQGHKLPRSITHKILIARAIINNPRLLLLEDPFENIDPEEGKKIIDYLVSDENPWTFIAVTSDSYLMEKVDEVAYMSRGTIIEKAPYHTLKTLISANV